jgi:ribonuclease Z
LLGRKEKLHLYGPPLLKKIIDLELKASNTILNYPLYFYPLSFAGFELIYEDEKLTVHSFPLMHSVPTCGFIFREKRQLRKIRKNLQEEMEISISDLHRLKRGESYTDSSGRLYNNEDLTTNPPDLKSYAYCSDTLYNERMIPYIQGCDLLYHEATFMQDRLQSAKDKMHSTAMEAALVAKKAKVKRLLIGHFSARYDSLQPLLDEALLVFENTIIAEDGLSIKI